MHSLLSFAQSRQWAWIGSWMQRRLRPLGGRHLYASSKRKMSLVPDSAYVKNHIYIMAVGTSIIYISLVVDLGV